MPSRLDLLSKFYFSQNRNYYQKFITTCILRLKEGEKNEKCLPQQQRGEKVVHIAKGAFVRMTVRPTSSAETSGSFSMSFEA
jgi:hypothetical protein